MHHVVKTTADRAAIPVLIVLGTTHLLNDMFQSLIPAIYPIIKSTYQLDFTQIGFITLAFQITASFFQPLVGYYTDKRPVPYSMVMGVGFTLMGLLILAYAHSYLALLVGASLVGLGSSVFHPEATRLARHAAAGQQGLAQGIFQVGGQTGGAIGPLLAAFVVVPRGQTSLAWLSAAALLSMVLLVWVSRWHSEFRKRQEGSTSTADKSARSAERLAPIPVFALSVLMILMMSKAAYSASFNSFYTFFLIDKFNVSVPMAQVMLFLFLAASATGALLGGIVGDRVGRKNVIWFSILGSLPFTLILPYADLFWTGALAVIINLIMSSAFAAILIYAIDLNPGRVGLIGGLFYGMSFGLGGLAAAIFGVLADLTSVEMVYRATAFLPALGLLTWFLPKRDEDKA